MSTHKWSMGQFHDKSGNDTLFCKYMRFQAHFLFRHNLSRIAFRKKAYDRTSTCQCNVKIFLRLSELSCLKAEKLRHFAFTLINCLKQFNLYEQEIFPLTYTRTLIVHLYNDVRDFEYQQIPNRILFIFSNGARIKTYLYIMQTKRIIELIRNEYINFGIVVKIKYWIPGCDKVLTKNANKLPANKRLS